MRLEMSKMKLWTIQPVEVYEILQRDGVFVADETKIDMPEFLGPYKWLCKQLNKKTPCPVGVTVPIWAWYQFCGKQKKPDLRYKSEEDIASLPELQYEILKASAKYLKPGGRMSIISFHSLEDRLVKNGFQKLERPCTCPSDFPICVCGKKQVVKIITKKPILPSEEELENNSGSHSAKLRVCEKV